MRNRRWDITIAAVIAVIFGVLTVVSGGRALFGGPEARAAVGDAVPFVLWFNFIAGFAYVAAGIGLVLRKPWAAGLSIAILVATILMMIAFGIHILLGGPYEMRTVWAMSLRTAIWGAIVGLAIREQAGLASRPPDKHP